jgi:hypothetical protein
MRKLLSIFLFGSSLFAAVTANTAWEVRTTGNAASGGGFDATIAGAGTDMSIFDNKNAAACTSCQSATVNISTTDAVTNNTTTVTSATANFSSAIVGNTIHLAGTGTTTGWYQVVTFTNSTTIVVDRATGSTGGTGVAMNIGGALRNVRDMPDVAGNTTWIKATATYTTASNFSFGTSGSSGLPISYVGYTSTRSDGGLVTVQATAGALNVFTGNGNFLRFRNITVDCNSQTTCRAFNLGGLQLIFDHDQALNFSVAGFVNNSSNQVLYRNSLASGGLTGCTAGFWISGIGNALVDNRATGNLCPGIQDTGTSGVNVNVYIRNVIDNNTGATTDGFQKTGTVGTVMVGNSIYKNGRDCIRLGAAGAVDFAIIENNIIYGCGNSGGTNAATAYGINSTTTNWANAFGVQIDYNAFGNNLTANQNQVPAGGHDVALSGDPFTSGGANDFSLNATAGAGAACKAVGFPGALTSGGTGNIDIGALQSAGTGGAAVTRSCAN